MTTHNFFYWLQGYFELTAFDGRVPPLNKAQSDTIVRHADLALAVTTDAPGVIRVKTMAELIARGLDATELTAAMQKTANDVFMHIIDPEAGDEQQQSKLNKVHGSHPGRKPGMRC